MKKLPLLLGFLLVALLPFCGAKTFANQSAATTYCVVPNPAQAGQVVAHAQANQDWQHAEQCGGQYGDLWSDGPFFSPSPSPVGLNLTLPANTWIVKGNRVATSAYTTPAPASTTSYWWVSDVTNSWTVTTSNSAPDNFSILGYKVVAGASSISSVSPAPYSNLLMPGLANGSSQCLGITGSGIVETGSCGGTQTASYFNITGSGITCVGFCSGSAGANTAGVLCWGVGVISTYECVQSDGNNISLVPCSFAVYNESTSTDLLCMDSAGSMANQGEIWVGHSLHSNREVIAGANTAPTPNAGTYGDVWASRSTTTGNMGIGGTSSSCDFDWNITVTSALTDNCNADVIGSLQAGASSATLPTVNSGDLSATRGGTSGALYLGGSGINGNGRIDYGVTLGNAFTISALTQVGGSVYASAPGKSVPSGTASGDLIAQRSTSTGALFLGGSVGSCGIDFGVTTSGTDTFGCPVSMTNSSNNYGTVSCTIASATNCSVSATVISGHYCVATMNSGSSAAAPYYAPRENTVGTTATFILTASTSESGTLEANYWCP